MLEETSGQQPPMAGTLAVNRRPRGAPPRSVAMLVLVQVSSMKTSRDESMRLPILDPLRRRGAMSRRSCSLAISDLFCR